MTVVDSTPAITTPLPGWGDVPGLPSGIWMGDVDVVGDGGGGSRIVSVIFAATGQSNPRFYSLEQLFLVDTKNSANLADLATSGMGSSRTGGPGPFRTQLVTVAGVSFAALSPRDQVAVQGVFLGRQSSRVVLADLSLSMTNTGADLLRIAVAGYVWDSQAMGSVGGLRRPPGPFKR